MQVRDIMSTRIATVELDDRLDVVRGIFDVMRFHHLLVVDEAAKLYGVVSDRDLLRALSPFIGSTVETARDTATLNKRVHQIMTRKPITLHPDAELDDVCSLLLTRGVSCIPIVDDAFMPVGIVTWRDALKALAASGAPEALDPPPAPRAV